MALETNSNVIISPSSPMSEVRADTLFQNHQLLKSRDPQLARSSVEGVFFKHLLRTSANTDPLNFVHRGAALASLSFNYISYGAEVEVSVNEMGRSHYILVMPLSGEAIVTNGDFTFDLSQGEVVVLKPWRPFKFEMHSNHSHLAIGIPKPKLDSYFARLCAPSNTHNVEFQELPYSSRDLDNSLFDFISYICRELDRPDSVTQKEFVAQSIEDTFLSLAFGALCDEKYSCESRENHASDQACVSRAEAFIEENLMELITAEDIAQAAEVPSRTLYRAYKKRYGTSPMGWLKQRRIRQARSDLIREAHMGATVTDIAMRYQSSHIGRFSRAYFNEFGEMPSDTQRKAKQAH